MSIPSPSRTSVSVEPSKPGDPVIISNTVKLKTERPYNRCNSDFLPKKNESIMDHMVPLSLDSLGRPLKIVRRRKMKYVEVPPNPILNLNFRVDLEESSNNEKTIEKKEQVEKKLQDLFTNPDASTSSDNSAISTGLSNTTNDGEDDNSNSVVLTYVEESKKNVNKLEMVDLAPAEIVNLDLQRAISYNDVKNSCNANDREKGRCDHIFSYFAPDFEYKIPLEKSVCRREPMPMWTKDFGTRLFVECRNLDLGLGEIEPYFCSLSLYDLKVGCRISEYFHFDMNSLGSLTGNLFASREGADPITLSKRAIFSVREPHENIHLVLKIDKVLQGDPDEGFDLYLSGKQRSPAEIEKNAKKIKATINRLSNYRQVLAYGIMPLFEYADSLLQQGDVKIERIYYQKECMSEEDFIRALKFALEDSGRKGKIFNGNFNLRIIKLTENCLPTNRVDPSYIPLKDSETIFEIPIDSEAKHHSVHIKEIEELPINPDLIPHNHFVNTLYVEPLNANFTACSTFGPKYRNVIVKVELRIQDGDLSGKGIKTIFGKSSTTVFSTQASTQVSYHNYCPFFQEEIKIMLPFGLTNNSHLFFILQQVGCQHKPGKKAEPDTIGYAVLPLYKYNRILDNNTYTLPVATTLTDFYVNRLDPSAEKKSSDVKFWDNGKPVFKVRIRTQSTVFTSDEKIISLFQDYPLDKDITINPKAKEISQEVVRQFRYANPNILVNYLSPILTHLFSMMNNNHCEETQFNAFSMINFLIERVQTILNENDRMSIISSYVTYHFDNEDIMPNLYLNITENWTKACADYQKDESNSDFQLAITNGWFWLDCIFKSMVIEKKDSNRVIPNSDTLNQEHEKFVEIFEQLLDIVANSMLHYKIGGYISLKRLNYNLALFFCDLFCVMRRSLVIRLMEVYLYEMQIKSDQNFSDPTVLDLKMTFYQIILDCEYYLDIMCPRVIEVNTISVNEDIMLYIRNKYPITDYLINDIGQNINWNNEAGQNMIIDTLRQIITKHDYDEKIQTPETRGSVACMYITLIPLLMDKVEVVNNFSPVVKRNIMICFLWIVRHVPRGILIRWFNTLDAEKIENFISLLLISMQHFEYVGMEVRREEKDNSKFCSILSPESNLSLFGADNLLGAPTTKTDYKADIELQISSIHQLSKSIRLSRAQSNAPTPQQPGTTVAPRSTSQSFSTTTGMSLRAMRAQQMGSVKGSTTSSMKTSTANSFGTMTRRRRDTYSSNSIKGLTVRSWDEIKKVVYFEQSLNECVGRTILNVFSDIVNLTCAGKAPENTKYTLSVCFIRFLARFLHYNYSDEMYLAVYPVLRFFLDSRGVYIFRHDKTKDNTKMEELVGDLTRFLMAHCTYDQTELRTNAVNVIYSLCRFNWLGAPENLDVMQKCLTVALSKEVARIKGKGASFLNQTLNALELLGTSDTSFSKMSNNLVLAAAFRKELSRVLNKTRTILQDSLEIARQEMLGSRADPAFLEDLYIQMADAFNHLPDVRIDWLKKLSDHNSSNNNHAEAGHCLIEICNLIRQQSKIDVQKVKSSNSLESSIDYYEKLTTNLKLACQELDKSELYEHCNEVYHELIPLLHEKRDFSALSEAYKHLSEIFSKLHEAENTQSRMLGTYYRITFYGKYFGRMDGVEYIYKMPKITRLAEVVSRMKSLYSNQLERDVKVVQTSGTIDPKTLDHEECILQVTFVDPEFNENEEKKREFYVDRNTNLRVFKFSTPFTQSGKSHADITEQYKRNTTLSVENNFPYLKTRQKVINRTEIELVPIMSAVEDIVKRTKFLLSLLSAKKVESKNLTNFLQGSILLQVNGGTKEVCQKFLNEEKIKEYSEGQIIGIQNALSDFLKACQTGLEKNSLLCQTEPEKKLQDALETEFQRMKNDMSPLLVKKGTEKVKKKKRPPGMGVRFKQG